MIFTEVLIARDGLTRTEAVKARKQASKHIHTMLEAGATYDDIEDYLMCEWGLEMDYIFDLI